MTKRKTMMMRMTSEVSTVLPFGSMEEVALIFCCFTIFDTIFQLSKLLFEWLACFVGIGRVLRSMVLLTFVSSFGFEELLQERMKTGT